MARVDTKSVFDAYFEQIDPKKAGKLRPLVDRPEVYGYEEELGKQIFDMNEDELLDMLISFNKKRTYGNKDYSISYTSYDQMASNYRAIWNYYINNIELIRNPWNSKKMRGANARDRIAAAKETISYSLIEYVLSKIRNRYDDVEYGKYLECLILLFYCGFASPKEIILLKEDMINFRTHDVRFPGKTIHLSDRCIELLQFIHERDEIQTLRKPFALVSYHGGYFKVAIDKNEVESFQERDIDDISACLNRKISMYVRNEYDVGIRGRTIYLLGFYDYIVKRAGKEHARDLITTLNNIEYTDELAGYAKEYGVFVTNSGFIKKMLRPYV